jgi:hypothetical protein
LEREKAALKAFLKGTMKDIPSEHRWVANWAVAKAGQLVAVRADQWVVGWVASRAAPWAAD